MKPSSFSEWERNRLARYEILQQHRMHVDRVSWSRIQTLNLIQAGVIGGSFLIYRIDDLPKYYIPVVLSLGLILTVLLFFLCIYDRESAQANDKRFYRLGDMLGIRWSAKRWKIKDIRWSAKKREVIWQEITAYRIRLLIIWLFIPVDLELVYFFNFKWGIAVTTALFLLIVLILIARRTKLLNKE